MSFLSNINDSRLPLRLIVTTKCNGNCIFCHNEGTRCSFDMDMDMDTINECALIANNLNIPKINITGGEPSIRQDLPEIISNIRAIYNGKIVLTSNGYKLLDCMGKITKELDRLNISIHSFKSDVISNYQNVSNDVVLSIISNFPAKEKNLNLVMNPDNCNEVPTIIDFCIKNDISLDIMFEFKDYTESENKRYCKMLKDLQLDYVPYLSLGTVPKMVVFSNKKCKINIKHPELSSIMKYPACINCKDKCYEFMCAVRVYPDKTVAPCLKNKIFASKLLSNNIKDAYQFIGVESPVEI